MEKRKSCNVYPGKVGVREPILRKPRPFLTRGNKPIPSSKNNTMPKDRRAQLLPAWPLLLYHIHSVTDFFLQVRLLVAAFDKLVQPLQIVRGFFLFFPQQNNIPLPLCFAACTVKAYIAIVV